MIVVIVDIVGIVVTVMILAIGSGGGGCDVKLVNVSSWRCWSWWWKTVCMMVDDVLVVVGDAVSCDSGMVVSTDTIASVADSGGRGGDAGDSGGDGVWRICGSWWCVSGC